MLAEDLFITANQGGGDVSTESYTGSFRPF